MRETLEKADNGITLLAVVITIIVLLILTGVTIATLTGNNGILTQAFHARKELDIAQEKEGIQIAKLSSEMEEEHITETIFQNEIDSFFGKEQATVKKSGSTFLVKFKNSQRTYKVYEDNTVVQYNVVSTLKGNKGSANYEGEYYAYKDKIKKIVFENQITRKEETSQSWDVSEEQNGNSMAYLVDDELYIQTEGIIAFPQNSSNLFHGFKNLESIVGLENVDTSKVNSMLSMFINCSKLTDLDVHDFNTSNVENMMYMFYGCSSLKKIDVSNFDTRKVRTILGLFYNCSSLEKIDLSNFDTSNVTSFQWLFTKCNNLREINLKGLDTSNVTSMMQMFSECKNLVNLDVSMFDTSKVTDMSSMFALCNSLTQLDVSNFDTSNVTNMGSMFYGCNQLQTLDLKNFITNKVTNMNVMFRECRNLKKLDISKFNTENVTSMSYMFLNCINLQELDLSSFDTKLVTNMYQMFYMCSNLKTIYVSDKWDTNNVTESTGMFSYCNNIIGENGTKYTDKHTSVEYARVDTIQNPGYLTYKNKVI